MKNPHPPALPKRKSHKEYIGNFMGTLSKLDGHMLRTGIKC
jgi:hypothetical protein